MRSFITGSHAYGRPGVVSDIDVVVLVTKADAETLLNRADNQEEIAALADYGQARATKNLRFGKLNLLCCTSLEKFKVWKDGTKRLVALSKKHGPITRDYAVSFFAHLRDGEKPPKFIPKLHCDLPRTKLDEDIMF